MPLQVNAKRGILRLWIVSSLTWMASIIIQNLDVFEKRRCIYGFIELDCKPKILGREFYYFWQNYYVENLYFDLFILIFVPPILIFIFALAGAWIIKGLKNY
jgi:hypothetical protein